MGEGINVIAAARLAKSGTGIDDLVTQVTAMVDRTKVWGALDTLENLKKDGKVAEGGKQRTRSKALAFVVEQFRAAGNVSNVAVLHAQCADVDGFIAQLRETYKGEIIVGDIGSVIGSHTGPGTIGVTYHVQ
jgi:fatty acid-binding protein DegV